MCVCVRACAYVFTHVVLSIYIRNLVHMQYILLVAL
jgi:hypothetical protein